MQLSPSRNCVGALPYFLKLQASLDHDVVFYVNAWQRRCYFGQIKDYKVQ